MEQSLDLTKYDFCLSCPDDSKVDDPDEERIRAALFDHVPYFFVSRVFDTKLNCYPKEGFDAKGTLLPKFSSELSFYLGIAGKAVVLYYDTNQSSRMVLCNGEPFEKGDLFDLPLVDGHWWEFSTRFIVSRDEAYSRALQLRRQGMIDMDSEWEMLPDST